MHRSAQIARALEKATGRKAKRIKVKMRGVRELNRFLKMFQKAQEDTRDNPSDVRYGDSHQHPAIESK